MQAARVGDGVTAKLIPFPEEPEQTRDELMQWVRTLYNLDATVPIFEIFRATFVAYSLGHEDGKAGKIISEDKFEVAKYAQWATGVAWRRNHLGEAYGDS